MIFKFIIVFTLLFHTLKLYVLRRYDLSLKNMHSIVSSLVSTLHAIMTLCIMLRIYFMLPETLYHEPQLYLQCHSEMILPPVRLTLAYMLYDLFWAIYYNNITKGILLHHCVTSTAMIAALISPYGRYSTFIMFLNEASTPFLNFHTISSILRDQGIYYVPDRITNMNRFVFFVVFFFSRIVILSKLAFGVYSQFKFQSLIINSMVALFSSHYLLNIYWFGLMCRKMMKLIRKN